MRDKGSESRHRVYWKGLRQCGRKRLSKKRDATFCFGARRKEATLETLVDLCDKEWRGTQTATAVWGINLMVKQLLHVVYGQQVLAIHGDNNRVPDLRIKYLKEKVRVCVGVLQNTPWACIEPIDQRSQGSWNICVLAIERRCPSKASRLRVQA